MPIDILYQFGGAVAELQLRLGGRNDSSGGIAFTSRLTQWLDSAQYLIARCPVSLPDLDTTTAILDLIPDQAEYIMNSTTPPITNRIGITLIQMVDPTSSPTFKMRMRRFPWNEYRALSQQASARPTRWTRRGDMLAFDPIPDKDGYEARIDYRRMPQQGVCNIDAAYQELWIKVAKWLAWSSLDQPDKARASLAELPPLFQTWIQMPLDEDQWEAMADPDIAIVPQGWAGGWYYA